MPPRRLPIPRAIADLVTALVGDREALLVLLASCVAIAAVGLDPHVLDPDRARVESLLASDTADSGLRVLVTAAALLQAALTLAGGAAADILRTERLLRAGLIGLVAASLLAIVVPDGPPLVAARVVAWASSGIIVPFTVAAVATRYDGTARATALGILLAVFGTTTSLAPRLVTLFDGAELPAFAACALVALVAVPLSARWIPGLPGDAAAPGRQVLLTATWAFGLVVVGLGVAQLSITILAAGVVITVLALLPGRAARRAAHEGIVSRAAGAALVAGVVVGFAQAMPLVIVPTFGGVAAAEGIDIYAGALPVVVGIFAAGPAAGWLVARWRPRALIALGLWVVGIANIALTANLRLSADTYALVPPLFLVGAGYAVATTVRTAVIFASSPRALAGTASGLNAASIGVGARMAVMFVVLVRNGVFTANPTAGPSAVDIRALQALLIFGGGVAIVGGVVVLVLMGSFDPVRRWVLREERPTRAE